MVNVRLHPGESDRGDAPREGGPGGPGAGAGGAAGVGDRLNLLLSFAGWQPESWADRLPHLLQPMGVRSLRASDGREASQVIRSYPIHIAVVDLGLPLESTGAQGDAAREEGGTRLLEVLTRLASPPPTVVVKRSLTRRDDSREIAAALRMGAFAVIDRPREPSDLEILLEVLRRVLHRYYRGRWPGLA